MNPEVDAYVARVNALDEAEESGSDLKVVIEDGLQLLKDTRDKFQQLQNDSGFDAANRAMPVVRRDIDRLQTALVQVLRKFKDASSATVAALQEQRDHLQASSGAASEEAQTWNTELLGLITDLMDLMRSVEAGLAGLTNQDDFVDHSHVTALLDKHAAEVEKHEEKITALEARLDEFAARNAERNATVTDLEQRLTARMQLDEEPFRLIMAAILAAELGSRDSWLKYDWDNLKRLVQVVGERGEDSERAREDLKDEVGRLQASVDWVLAKVEGIGRTLEQHYSQQLASNTNASAPARIDDLRREFERGFTGRYSAIADSCNRVVEMLSGLLALEYTSPATADERALSEGKVRLADQRARIAEKNEKWANLVRSTVDAKASAEGTVLAMTTAAETEIQRLATSVEAATATAQEAMQAADRARRELVVEEERRQALLQELEAVKTAADEERVQRALSESQHVALAAEVTMNEQKAAEKLAVLTAQTMSALEDAKAATASENREVLQAVAEAKSELVVAQKAQEALSVALQEAATERETLLQALADAKDLAAQEKTQSELSKAERRLLKEKQRLEDVAVQTAQKAAEKEQFAVTMADNDRKFLEKFAELTRATDQALAVAKDAAGSQVDSTQAAASAAALMTQQAQQAQQALAVATQQATETAAENQALLKEVRNAKNAFVASQAQFAADKAQFAADKAAAEQQRAAERVLEVQKAAEQAAEQKVVAEERIALSQQIADQAKQIAAIKDEQAREQAAATSTTAAALEQLSQLRSAVQAQQVENVGRRQAPQAAPTQPVLMSVDSEDMDEQRPSAAAVPLARKLLAKTMPKLKTVTNDNALREGHLLNASGILDKAIVAEPTQIGGNGDESVITRESLRKRLDLLHRTYQILMSVPALLRFRGLSPNKAKGVNYKVAIAGSSNKKIVTTLVDALYVHVDANLYGIIGKSMAVSDIEADTKVVRALLEQCELPPDPQPFVRRGIIHEALMNAVLSAQNEPTPEVADVVVDYIQKYTNSFDGLLKNVQNLSQLNSVLSIESNMPTPRVLTYVRIRSNNPRQFNARFQISLDKPQKYLQVAHYPTDYAIYDAAGEELDPSAGALAEQMSAHDTFWADYPEMQIDNNQNGGVLPKAPFTYVYGPLTRVFIPTQNNSEIAEECRGVADALLGGRSVFMIGYGASGAGKTSALVHLHTKTLDDPGIIVRLLELTRMMDKYGRLEVTVYEYQTKGAAGECESIKRGEANVVFVSKDGGFVAETEQTDPSDLGQYLYAMINNPKDRLIRPTPNNPESSRSHVLAVVHLFTNDGESGPSLFLADLAGVENRFMCDDLEELHRFASVVQVEQTALDGKLQYCGRENMDGVSAVYGRQSGGALLSAEQWPAALAQISPPTLIADTTYTLVPLITLPKDQPSASDTNWLVECMTYVLQSLFDVFPAQASKISRKFLTKYFSLNLAEDEYFRDAPDKVQFFKYKNGYQKDTIAFAKFFGIVVDNIESVAAYDDDELSDFLKPSPVGFLNALNRYGKAYSQQPGSRQAELGGIDRFSDGSKPWFDRMIEHKLMRIYKDKRPAIYSNNGALAFNTKPGAQLEWHDGIFLAYFEARRLQFRERARRVSLLAHSCRCRAYEGAFINKSLRQLTQRLLIEKMVKAVAADAADTPLDLVPTFSEGCIPQQCNPWLDNCFGSRAKAKALGMIKSNDTFVDLIKAIVLPPNQPPPLIAVFCVINMNRTDNNPPKTPFIDITDLKMETSRLYNLPKIAGVLNKLPETSFTVSSGEGIDKKIVGNLKKWLLFYETKIGSTVFKAAMKFVTALQASTKVSDDINYANQLIALIDTMNATHMLGTLAFTEDMSKFGRGTDVCSFSDHNVLSITRRNPKELKLLDSLENLTSRAL